MPRMTPSQSPHRCPHVRPFAPDYRTLSGYAGTRRTSWSYLRRNCRCSFARLSTGGSVRMIHSAASLWRPRPACDVRRRTLSRKVPKTHTSARPLAARTSVGGRGARGVGCRSDAPARSRTRLVVRDPVGTGRSHSGYTARTTRHDNMFCSCNSLAF